MKYLTYMRKGIHLNDFHQYERQLAHDFCQNQNCASGPHSASVNWMVSEEPCLSLRVGVRLTCWLIAQQ